MHMLVENATLPRGQILGKGFPQALVHTVHTLFQDCPHGEIRQTLKIEIKFELIPGTLLTMLGSAKTTKT